MIGNAGVAANESITYQLTAVGKTWQWNGSSFVIGGINSSQLIVVGNYNPNSFNWPVFNFKRLYGGPHWSLGIYKVSNSLDPNKYFYIDSRDSDFGSAVYNTDFFIVYDAIIQYYRHYEHTKALDSSRVISKGEIIRVWNLHNMTPNTSGLENYWQNALVIVPSEDPPNCPRLIWGPIPNFNPNGYQIFWRFNENGDFVLLAVVNAATYEFVHGDLQTGGIFKAEYKVRAFNQSSFSSFTNTVEISTKGFYKNISEIESSNDSFTLRQNYPNPFNAATSISFILSKDSFVKVKIYDILGHKISEPVREIKSAGKHTISLDATNLPSGVYFYELECDGKRIRKKMNIIK